MWEKQEMQSLTDARHIRVYIFKLYENHKQQQIYKKNWKVQQAQNWKLVKQNKSNKKCTSTHCVSINTRKYSITYNFISNKKKFRNYAHLLHIIYAHSSIKF